MLRRDTIARLEIALVRPERDARLHVFVRDVPDHERGYPIAIERDPADRSATGRRSRGQHRAPLKEAAMSTRCNDAQHEVRHRRTPQAPLCSSPGPPALWSGAAAALILLLALAPTASALGLIQTINRLNIQTAQDATIGGLDSLERISPSALSWSGTVTDSSWTYSTSGIINGKQLSVSLHGSLVGVEGGTLHTVVTGTGVWGPDPITVNGISDWLYSPALGGYSNHEYGQVTQLGAHTHWFWKVARFAAGAALGAAVVVGTVATGGTILIVGAAVVGGLAGGASAVETGKYVDEICGNDMTYSPQQAEQACPPPDPPTPPELPGVGQHMALDGLGVGAVDDANFAGTSRDRRLHSRASVSGNGTITGSMQIGSPPITPGLSGWWVITLAAVLLGAGTVFVVRTRYGAARS
jgi:hypothetical protein